MQTKLVQHQIEKPNTVSEITEIMKKEICEICKKEFNSATDMMTHTSLEHLAETIQFAKKHILHPNNKENVKTF